MIAYDDAVRAGVGLFIRTGTIDMDALARRLAVSRATLYRVVPGRDRLLGDVLWRQTVVLFDDARSSAPGEGTERVLAILRHFGRAIMAAEPFRRFIASEPETAIRVLFTSSGGVHDRFVELNRQLLDEAVRTGHLAPSFDLCDLAYVFVRIFESMWYADLLSGREPNLDVAEHAARSLLLGGANLVGA